MIPTLPCFGELAEERVTISLTFELNTPEEEKIAFDFAQNYRRREKYTWRGLDVSLFQVVYLSSDITDSEKAELKLVLDTDTLL